MHPGLNMTLDFFNTDKKNWSELAFDLSPQSLVLIDPYSDVVLVSNNALRALIGAVSRGSDLFGGAITEWLVFTEEVLELGEAWSDCLHIAGGADLPDGIAVDVTGHRVEQGGAVYVLFSLVALDKVERRLTLSEAQYHYRSGIAHWDRVAQVFREFERENQLLLDAAGEGIYGIDQEGKTTFVNAAAERMLGWTKADLIGRNMHYLIHHSHKDGERFPSHECSIFKAARDGVQCNVENEVFWTKDGRAIDVEYTSTPIMDDDQGIGTVVIFRDVTQKRLDQQNLLNALSEVEQLKTRLEMENAYLQEEISSEYNYHHIVGQSDAIRVVLDKISMVAPTDASVLITGESGTGKELIARAIHELSTRRERSLIRVNCAAIPADLFESEFFGHCKGAFTGAVDHRIGRFELADGGSLFLDEVGEIPLALQGKLLRVLQEQSFERVGDSVTRHVDVRIIAATNKNLKALVDVGKFREDLYFRLNVFPVESVPLRQRKEDIPLLASHFLKRASVKANKPHLKIPISQIECLQRYSWPGNIRELENVIERQVILAKRDTLSFRDLPKNEDDDLPIQPSSAELNLVTDAELKQRDRTNILRALRQSGGKVSGRQGAAVLLDMKPSTLTSRIKKYCIDVDAFKNEKRAVCRQN